MAECLHTVHDDYQINNLALNGEFHQDQTIKAEATSPKLGLERESQATWISCNTCYMCMLVTNIQLQEILAESDLGVKCFKCCELDALQSKIDSLQAMVSDQDTRIKQLQSIHSIENELDSTLNEISNGVASLSIYTDIPVDKKIPTWKKQNCFLIKAHKACQTETCLSSSDSTFEGTTGFETEFSVDTSNPVGSESKVNTSINSLYEIQNTTTVNDDTEEKSATQTTTENDKDDIRENDVSTIDLTQESSSESTEPDNNQQSGDDYGYEAEGGDDDDGHDNEVDNDDENDERKDDVGDDSTGANGDGEPEICDWNTREAADTTYDGDDEADDDEYKIIDATNNDAKANGDHQVDEGDVNSTNDSLYENNKKQNDNESSPDLVGRENPAPTDNCNNLNSSRNNYTNAYLSKFQEGNNVKTIVIGDSSFHDLVLGHNLMIEGNYFKIAASNSNIGDRINNTLFFLASMFSEVTQVVFQVGYGDVCDGKTEKIKAMLHHFVQFLNEMKIKVVICGPIPFPGMKNEAFSRAYAVTRWLTEEIRYGEITFSFVNSFELMWGNKMAFFKNRNKLSCFGNWLLECAITDACSSQSRF